MIDRIREAIRLCLDEGGAEALGFVGIQRITARP